MNTQIGVENDSLFSILYFALMQILDWRYTKKLKYIKSESRYHDTCFAFILLSNCFWSWCLIIPQNDLLLLSRQNLLLLGKDLGHSRIHWYKTRRLANQYYNMKNKLSLSKSICKYTEYLMTISKIFC